MRVVFRTIARDVRYNILLVSRREAGHRKSWMIMGITGRKGEPHIPCSPLLWERRSSLKSTSSTLFCPALPQALPIIYTARRHAVSCLPCSHLSEVSSTATWCTRLFIPHRTSTPTAPLTLFSSSAALRSLRDSWAQLSRSRHADIVRSCFHFRCFAPLISPHLQRSLSAMILRGPRLDKRVKGAQG